MTISFCTAVQQIITLPMIAIIAIPQFQQPWSSITYHTVYIVANSTAYISRAVIQFQYTSKEQIYPSDIGKTAVYLLTHFHTAVQHICKQNG